MLESEIQNRVRLAASKIGARLFRNNIAKAWVGEIIHQTKSEITLRYYRRLHSGLFQGSSDCVGWYSVVVTPDMVGQRVALFCAVEVKTPTGRVKPEQQNFIDQVKKAGGIAGIVRSEQEAIELFAQPYIPMHSQRDKP